MIQKKIIKFWGLFREALHGTHYDYTQGPIGTAVVLLAIPMVMEMLMESIFAVVDVFFVAKLGANAVATVGLTESLLTFIYTLGLGLSIGVMAMVARRIGEQDPEGASFAASQALILGLIVSVTLGIIGFIYAPNLLNLMGASPEIVETGAGYTSIMLGGNAAILMLFLVNSICRATGDGAIAMRALWLANGINIFLAPALIFGPGPFPELGIQGAAIGTTIGRSIGVLYTLTHLLTGRARVKITLAHFKILPDTLYKLLQLSGAGTLQTFIGMASWVGLVKILSGFGSAAIAGYTIGIRIVLFALFPAFGLSNAAATMVGQALGAKDPERAEKSVWLAGFYNACFLGTIGLLFVIFAHPLCAFFTHEPQVVAYATECLRIVAAGFLFYAYGMVLTQSFNGAGDTWTPTAISFFIYWAWELPLAYFLAHTLEFGPSGIFISILVAFSSLAVVSGYLFRKGKWKYKNV